MISTSLNHCKKMGAEPGRKFLKQPAAKLEPVIAELSKCNTSAVFPRVKRINTTTQQHKWRNLFKSFPQRFMVILLFPVAFD